ncbi:hypothetical protein VTP01DRAFT_7292 [Rhizomucor pusillus]|uniref:uncharacterized protein n=1 Tax=Rhizomucor pusillus TaxID=4840 RepID=UPI003743326C
MSIQKIYDIIVKPPSSSSLPAFIYEAARQHDLRKFMVDWVSSATDVKADGNCGYRAFAIGLGESEDVWRDVRLQCLQELTSRRIILDFLVYLTITEQSEAPYSGMMVHVVLALDAYGTLGLRPDECVQATNSFFSALNLYTFLPDNASPNNNSPVSSLLMKHSAHYVNIRLALGAPIPQIIKSWKRHRTKDSLGWEHRLTKQRDMFTKPFLEHCPKEDPTEQIDLEDVLDPSQQLVDYELK